MRPWQILVMAWRNVWRHRRRTALSVLGIGLGLALATTSSNFNYGSFEDLIRDAIAGTAGHVVVQGEGYQEERDPAVVVTDSEAVRGRLAALYPDATITRRSFVGGLLTSPRGTAAITLSGVEPSVERGLTRLAQHLVQGEWLADDDAHGVLIGDRLAERLTVGVGDKLVFMAQVGDGEMDSRMLRVRGIFHSGSESLDSFGGVTTLASAAALLPGSDPAHQVAVLLPEVGIGRVDLDPATAALAGLPGLEVLGWDDVLPMLRDQMGMKMASNRMIASFVAIIVGVGVLNTVLMGMMERVREFGVMLAVGLRPASLGALLLAEGLWIGLLGVGLGLVCAGLLWQPLYVRGIDFGELMSDALPVGGVVFNSVLRARVNLWENLAFVAAAVLMTLAASAWPAWKATRIEPVAAMRHT